MKTKYCYIPNVENFTDETMIFAVYVGTSNRELAQCRVVDAYACKNGAFWRPWDQDTDNFLMAHGYKFFSASEQVSQVNRRLDFEIPAFVKHIQNGDLLLIKTPAYINRNRMHQLAALSPAIHLQNHARRAGIMCNTVTRKYLSHGEMGNLVRAAGGFCLILILFLVGAYLDGIEPLLLQY